MATKKKTTAKKAAKVPAKKAAKKAAKKKAAPRVKAVAPPPVQKEESPVLTTPVDSPVAVTTHIPISKDEIWESENRKAERMLQDPAITAY